MWEIQRDEVGNYFAVIDGVTVIALDATNYMDAVCEADQRCGVSSMADLPFDEWDEDAQDRLIQDLVADPPQ